MFTILTCGGNQGDDTAAGISVTTVPGIQFKMAHVTILTCGGNQADDTAAGIDVTTMPGIPFKTAPT